MNFKKSKFFCETKKSIYGAQNIDFHGERRKEDLIEFVERADA